MLVQFGPTEAYETVSSRKPVSASALIDSTNSLSNLTNFHRLDRRFVKWVFRRGKESWIAWPHRSSGAGMTAVRSGGVRRARTGLRRALSAGLSLALAVLASPSFATLDAARDASPPPTDPPSCQLVRLADIGWTDVTA